ncbi:hypothetical protein NLO95_12390, partial [Pseudomonas syringae]|nr:hypothetical protein [Pseudomonas syringae]
LIHRHRGLAVLVRSYRSDSRFMFDKTSPPAPTKENCPYPALTGIMSVIINNKLNERSMALPRDAVTT